MGSDDSEAGDDDGDMEVENECEYSDLEAASGDADASDYGVHQFIAKDDAGDPMGSDDSKTVEAPEIFVAMLVAPESTESRDGRRADRGGRGAGDHQPRRESSPPLSGVTVDSPRTTARRANEAQPGPPVPRPEPDPPPPSH